MPSHSLLSERGQVSGWELGREWGFQGRVPPGLFVVHKQLTDLIPGARGLRSIIESLLIDTMYEVPGSDIEKVIVNSDTVLNKTPPIYVQTPKEMEALRPAEMIAKQTMRDCIFLTMNQKYQWGDIKLGDFTHTGYYNLPIRTVSDGS